MLPFIVPETMASTFRFIFTTICVVPHLDHILHNFALYPVFSCSCVLIFTVPTYILKISLVYDLKSISLAL